MATPKIKQGEYTGTGAAINIQLGFVPTYVRVINVTDGDAGLTYMNTGTARNVAEGAALATQASNGISVYDGTAGGNGAGFTAGTAVSVSAKVYHYLALRDDDV